MAIKFSLLYVEREVFINYYNFLQLQSEYNGSVSSSGSATSELLSPVQDSEFSALSPAEIKAKQLLNLNTQLQKINVKTEVIAEQAVETVVHGATAISPDEEGAVGGPLPQQKTRRVSRFKVSVVTEPDRGKLVIPNKFDDQEDPRRSSDYTSVINNTFDSLANILAGTLPPTAGNCIFLLSVIID